MINQSGHKDNNDFVLQKKNFMYIKWFFIFYLVNIKIIKPHVTKSEKDIWMCIYTYNIL